MQELKSCPFCGGEAEIQTSKRWPDGVEAAVDGYTVVCQNLDCIFGGNDEWWADTEAEAIEAWNTRHEDTCRMEPLNAFYTDLNGLNQTEWGVCSNCGTASPIDATYCCECGRKVER